MDHHAVIRHLRAALRRAVKERGRALRVLEQAEFDRPLNPREPDFNAMSWWEFARYGYDLSNMDPGALRVSEANAEAGLDLLAAFIEHAGRLDVVVQVQPVGRKIQLAFEGRNLSVTVRERFIDGGHVDRPRSDGIAAIPTKAGSGKFVLVIEGLGSELELQDGKTSLTDQIRTGSVFDRMRRRAEHDRKKRAVEAEQSEIWRQQQAVAEAARLEKARVEQEAAANQARKEKLAQDAIAWDSAELVRRYVGHVAATGGDPNWVAWALKVADEMDPTNQSPRPPE